MTVMARITKAERKKIEAAMEKEFPNDPALQQVHIARKILARKLRTPAGVRSFPNFARHVQGEIRDAELEGLSFGEYIMKRHRQEVNPKTGLRFRQKVESGLKELDAGKGIPHRVVRERLKKRF